MKNRVSKGLNIRSRSNTSCKKQILFIHGNSSSSLAFLDIIHSGLFEDYQCIAIDLPGHGDSDRDPQAAHDPSIYTMDYYSKFIEEFLHHHNFEQPILVGHSLGGHIATLVSHRVDIAGLFSFQAPPLEFVDDISDAFLPIDELNLLFSAEVSDKKLRQFTKSFLYVREREEEVFSDFKRTDPLCRKNMGESLASGIRLGEVSIFNSLERPKAIVFTDKDPMINRSYLLRLQLKNLWREKPFMIENLGHYPHIENSELFSRVLKSFLDDNNLGSVLT